MKQYILPFAGQMPVSKKSYTYLFYYPLLLPVFFDLGNRRFIVEYAAFGYETIIPLPIGFFILTLTAIYCVLPSRNKMFYHIWNNKVEMLVFLLSSFFLFSIIFLTGLSVVRLLQLAFPLIFLFGILLPYENQKIKKSFDAVLVGFLLFICLHLVSIIIDTKLFALGFSTFTDRDFPLFFGLSIYQSLVVYPAVLSLVSTIFLYCIISNKKIGYYGYLLSFLLLLLAARRVSFFEILIQLLFIGLWFFLIICSNKIKIKKILEIIFIFFLLGFIFFNSPLLYRFIERLSSNTFSGGRIEIYANALEVLNREPFGLLFGYGGHASVGFHNFILDTFHRAGMIGTLLYFVLACAFVLKIIKSIKVKLKTKQILFICIIIFQFLIQMMVNSPLTQPYYFVALFFSVYFILFYPIELNSFPPMLANNNKVAFHDRH